MEETVENEWQPMDTAPRFGQEVDLRIGATVYERCMFDRDRGRWRWLQDGARVLGMEPDAWRAR